MMTAPESASLAPARVKPLNWLALVLVALAACVNLFVTLRWKPVPYYSWALIVGLALSVASSSTSNRNLRNLLSGLAIGVVVVAIYGYLKHLH
ncbi:MAG TPA: hypothetical protein VN706_12470 [Gemmatimonadaceae bacterium]|nr:hypothetical protein [Gemmatimonadaceae bacterium]